MNESRSQQDTSWLRRIQENDEQALASLMHFYYTDLYNYGRRFTNDEALIKDCIQEIFISLWQRRQNAGSILSPKFYLLRALKNKVLKSLDSAQRKMFQGSINDTYDGTYEFCIESVIITKEESAEKKLRLKTIIACLSKREQEAVYLKYYLYLDNSQIAELMSLNPQSVYNLLHEAIRKMRGLWHREFLHQ